jgi:hypothetical protein
MHLASDTIARTAIGRPRAKELPVDAEPPIYERVLRFSAPILPLLAQDCGHFAPGTEPLWTRHRLPTLWRTETAPPQVCPFFANTLGLRTVSVLMKGERGVMARWSSEYRLWAVAFVALSCSGCDAHAAALCENCPELFASTPTAEQAALPRRRSQGTRPHDRYVSRRLHQRRDDSRPPPLLARRTPLTAFAAVTVERGAADASVSATIADPAPLGPDATMPATPALRIDELFNIMGAEPSDQPEEVAALRANMLSQFRMRQSAPGPDDRIGYLVPTLIVFGGCLILIGAVLVSADKSQFPERVVP